VVERLGDPNTGTAETIAIKGASIGGGDGGGFVVTPPSGVPEPATIGLFITGLGGLFLLRRKA
jgi:hypothetical protein